MVLSAWPLGITFYAPAPKSNTRILDYASFLPICDLELRNNFPYPTVCAAEASVSPQLMHSSTLIGSSDPLTATACAEIEPAPFSIGSPRSVRGGCRRGRDYLKLSATQRVAPDFALFLRSKTTDFLNSTDPNGRLFDTGDSGTIGLLLLSRPINGRPVCGGHGAPFRRTGATPSLAHFGGDWIGYLYCGSGCIRQWDYV